jgi:hypothetical protein
MIVQGALECQRGQHGASGMVLMRNGRPEQRHKPVTKELIDRPFVPVHLIEHQLEKAVEQGVHMFRTNALGERGRVDEVAEEDRDLLAFAF